MNDDIVVTKPDAMGRHWIFVTKHEAWSHPKGRPGLALFLISLWFAAVGAFELSVAIRGGLPLFSHAMAGATAITGILLMLRIPWAYVAAVILPVRQVFGFIELIGTEGVEPPLVATVYAVANAIIGIGVIFHLLEGDRPNLIYRHRYRSYKAERGDFG